FRRVARRLLQAAERNTDLRGVVVVGADEVRPAHRAEMLHHELGGVVAAQQVLAADPSELRGVDRGAGPKRRAVPPPAPGAVTVKDRAELASDLVRDSLAQTATGEGLHARVILCSYPRRDAAPRATLRNVTNSPLESHQGGARVRFPPPLVFLGFLLVGAFINSVVLPLRFPIPRSIALAAGGFLVVAAIALLAAALRLF